MSFSRSVLSLAACIVAGWMTLADAEHSAGDLVEAAHRGDGHAVHRLVEAGVDLDARDPMGYTALHWAGIRGHWRIFAELIAAGAPVDAIGGDGGTPLHWTCHHDRPEMVGLLLDAGADVHVRNRWGRTPLHVAARRNCMAVAETLLDVGADPNATTDEGWTPLHVAARSGNVSMMNLLETRGADPTRCDLDDLTPQKSWHRRAAPIPADSRAFTQYEGIYDLGGGFSVKVWLEDGTLRIREFAPDELYPVAIDEFGCRREPWRVRFLRSDTGGITGIEVDYLRRTVQGTRKPSPRYIGARRCLECHLAADHGQGVAWIRSQHAHAYWRLSGDWARYLAGLRPHYRDVEDPVSDERCLLCHVTGSQDPDAIYAASFRPADGISCEACHGAGSLYANAEVMPEREAFLANGGRIPDQSTCRSCHRNPENFDWDERWPQIAHPRPAASHDEGSS
jgi:hypothetical protein